MHENYQFLADPLFFLQYHPLSCYAGDRALYSNDFANTNVSTQSVEIAPAFSFDILKKSGIAHMYELRIKGTDPGGPGNNPFNPNIIGHWIPFFGLPREPDVDKFGRFRLDNAQADFIFTYHMDGCHLVVIKDPSGGPTYLFHEPTQEKWKRKADYSALGNEIFRTSPEYDQPGQREELGVGTVVLRRWFGVWFIIVQTMSVDGVVLSVTERRLDRPDDVLRF